MVSELKTTWRPRRRKKQSVLNFLLSLVLVCIAGCLSEIIHSSFVFEGNGYDGTGGSRNLREVDAPKLEELRDDMGAPDIFVSENGSINKTLELNSAEAKPGLWNNSTILPDWMKNYFDWHREQKENLTEENFHSYRFIIMIARRGQVAGGLIDRLRPLPAFLRIANSTNRLFLIHWDRPAHLEEFLLPPEGGLDWRVPQWMEPHLHDHIKANGNQNEIIRVAKSEQPIQLCIYQSWNYGELYYNEHLQPGEPDAQSVLREIWPIAFTPSPPVAARIEDQFQHMGIVPGEYATAHIRALYAVQSRHPDEIRSLTFNALNCASQLRPGGPFFVASDSSYAMELALAYGRIKNVTVVGRTHAHRREPLHIGYHEVNETHNTVQDFYDTFVDSYLIAMTRCVAFGKGGYGRWGLVMGYNNTCHHTHHGSKWAVKCDWQDPTPQEQERNLERLRFAQLQLPLFRKPMQDRHHVELHPELLQTLSLL